MYNLIKFVCIILLIIEQSLYSYAYEHTFIPVSPPPTCSQGIQPVESTDDSYVEPDTSAVVGFMEELKNKEAISSGQYEIPEEGEEEEEDEEEEGEEGEGGEEGEEGEGEEEEEETISSGQYEIPEEECVINKDNVDDQEDIHPMQGTALSRADFV
jgi:hypothetical protein